MAGEVGGAAFLSSLILHADSINGWDVSKKIEPTLSFRMKRSQIHDRLLTILHLLGLLACWLNNLPVGWRLGLSALLILLWARYYRGVRMATFYLSYTANQSWSVSFDGDNYLPAKIEATTVITTLVALIHLSIDGKTAQSLIVFKDTLPVDDYRRLIVKLKLSGYGQRE
jgi:hypothetical protein